MRALAKKLSQLEESIAAANDDRENTVFGIVRSNDGSVGERLRCWQRDDKGQWIQVQKHPVFDIPERLEPILVKDKRYKVVYGGRGSGKTEGLCRIILADALDMKRSYGCFRQFQNSIEDSVYSDLANLSDSLGSEYFNITDNKIKGDGFNFSFRGLDRNILSVKGMNKYERFWYEESESLKQDSMDVCTRTLRKKGSEHLFSFNPKSSQDPISKKFIVPFQDSLDRDGYYEDDMHIIIKLNWKDNPWFNHCELPKDREKDFKSLPRALYDHFWEGAFNDSVENAIIPAEWFDACVDAHIKLGFEAKGAAIVSHDPSDQGNDSKGLVYRHGSVVLDVQEKEDGDVNEGMDWALDYAIQAQADYFTWDGDGMGAPLRRNVDQALNGKKVEPLMFRGSESPFQPDMIYQPTANTIIRKSARIKEVFRNKRSQCYIRLQDRVYNTYRAVVHKEYCDPDEMISFSSDIKCMAKLRSEVCRLPLKPNGNGYIQMMTKDDMRKIDIPSPNLSDSLMMSLADFEVMRHNVSNRPPPKRKLAR